MMEEKFKADAGLGELIKFCEEVPALRKRAEILKKERSEVIGETSLEKNGQEAGPATPTSTTNHMLASEGGETSTAQAQTSTAQTKRKQITRSEGGKKKKLSQEQAQLPEPLGTDIKKDEDCLKTPLMPPPTPPSSSSNKKQKNTTIPKHDIIKTGGPQEIHQLVELSSSSNFPALSELPTFEGLSAIPSSRLQSSQKPLEAPLDLKMSPSSSRSPCHNLPVSLSSDSNVHLNSNAHSIQSSGAQVPHVPSATGFSNVGIPLMPSETVSCSMPSETVSCSSIAPHMSSIKVPSSIHDLHLPAQEAFSSREDPHNQAIASKNLQTTKMPPTTLTSKAQLLKMPSPAIASSSVQVSHTPATLSRSISVRQIPQTTTSSSIQILNSATIKASKNVQASQVSLPTEPNYFQASVAPPSATPSSSTSLLVPLSKATSRAQSTQIHPETESICVQAHHAPPSTVSRNKCTTQLTQGAASGTGKAFSLPEVKVSMKVQAPQVSSPTASISILNLNATPPTTSSNLLAPHATSSTASSSLLAPHATLSTTSSNLLAPHATSSTASSSLLAPHATRSTTSSILLAPYAILPTASSSLLAPHATLSTTSSSLLAPHATLPTASSNLLAPQATLSTPFSSLLAPHATLSTTSSSLLAPHATLPTASSNLLAPQLCPVTASRALSATPVPSSTVHSSPSWTPRRGTVPKEPSREEGHHQGPKQVMVLKVTEPFTYDLEEDKRMFHATVATETEFFRVKVFDTALISKFIPRNIIAISDYFGCNGFLEIYRASCVSDVNVNPTMVISNTLRQRANATPKVSYLFSQAKGTFVSGEYLVIKKTERNKAIYYGIKDDTGKMEVMVYGRLTNITCEPGNKLRLVCFELNPIEDGLQLKSVRHSYMQVINARR
ncbi:pyrin domain-containing protein 3-like isoform X2 [Mus caroli]|nr:pyrin domain-containing protein 3-like isoform X2 [Mus caroli]